MVQFTQTLVIQFSRGKCCRMEGKDGGKSNQLYRIYIYFFFVLSPEKPLILICPYHYTLFYCTLLYCASQILRFCFAFFFFKLTCLLQLYTKHLISAIFPTAFAYFVFLSHILVILGLF